MPVYDGCNYTIKVRKCIVGLHNINCKSVIYRYENENNATIEYTNKITALHFRLLYETVRQSNDEKQKENRPLCVKFFSQLIFVTIKDLRGMCICLENNFCDRKIILKW